MSSSLLSQKLTSGITELPNELTSDIDLGDAKEIVRILRQSDAQLFAGYYGFPSIYDEEIMSKMIQFAKIQTDLIEKFVHQELSQTQQDNYVIVFSGCGTSGRLSHFCAKSYNEVLTQFLKHEKKEKSFNNKLFDYLIAGGDKALVSAQEAAEDKPEQGIQDLTQLKKQKKYIYVGITCGLSAPYVAGQLALTMNKNLEKESVQASVLLGFNPTQLARNVAMEGWNYKYNEAEEGKEKTFRQIVNDFEKQGENYMVLNPVVGPESITGSTRMKGGSATKILLDVCFGASFSAFMKKYYNGVASISDEEYKKLITSYLNEYEATYRSTYNHLNGIAKMVDFGQAALRNSGKIYYLGYDQLGIVGFIDASECMPTYGADFKDVRGFILNGWDSVQNKELDMMKTLQLTQYQYQINAETHFAQNFVPSLTEEDVVVIISHEAKEAENSKQLRQIFNTIESTKKSKLVWLQFVTPATPRQAAATTSSSERVLELEIEIPAFGLFPKSHHMSLSPLSQGSTTCLPSFSNISFTEFSLKLILNAMTTGAHVLKGMTYGNRMINLRVSNHKLFYRALQIIQSLMKVSEERAKRCLLASIYSTEIEQSQDEEPEQQVILKYWNQTIESHVYAAAGKSLVVPVALLLAASTMTKNISVKEAKQILQQEPIVRNVIQKYLK